MCFKEYGASIALLNDFFVKESKDTFMKNNIKIILVAIIAIAVGLGIGYFIFGNNASMKTAHEHEGIAVMTSGEETIFTCSMHPQIRQNEMGICPICEMDLIPLDDNLSDDPTILKMTENAIQLANIQTTVVGAEGSAEKELLLTGKIKEDEREAVSLVAHVPGRIEQLFVTFTGEKVMKGQKLVTIYSPELITAQRELIEALKFKGTQPSLVEAARNKLRFWKIPHEMITVLEQKKVIRETMTMHAESEGIVTNRRVSVGDHIPQGGVLFDIVNLDKVWVMFDAYEEDLANIKVGDRISFTTPALTDKVFKTTITYIDPIINPATRVASLRAEVNNKSGLLKPEMFVRGTIQSRLTKNRQLMIPKSAVLWTGKRSVVYVKLPDMEIPSFKYREVVLGEALGANYLIEEGLEVGEEVVTNGNFTIDAAAQLNNQQSMMNKIIKVKKEKAVGVPDYKAVAPAQFKKQLNILVTQYMLVKDAFVETDPTSAAQSAQAFNIELENVEMQLLEGESHIFWMELLKGLDSHSQKITELKDVEDQRRQFGFISDLMIQSVKAFGIDGDDVFIQFCPMAFDNEGADWLSTEEGIRNPYFGDRMMKCGSVKSRLTF